MGEMFTSAEVGQIIDKNARLQKLLDQKLDDNHVIRLMVDPDGRFESETLVWIVNWLRQHDRIQPPKKTRKGWE